MSDRHRTIVITTCLAASIIATFAYTHSPSSLNDACLRACGVQGVAEVDGKRCLCRSVTSVTSGAADAAASASPDGAVP